MLPGEYGLNFENIEHMSTQKMKLRAQKKSHQQKSNSEMDSSSSDSISELESEHSEPAAKVENVVKAGLCQVRASEISPSTHVQHELFIIDKTPSTSKVSQSMTLHEEQDSSDSDSDSEEEESHVHKQESGKSKNTNDRYNLASSLDIGMDIGDMYVNMDVYKNPAASAKAMLSCASNLENEVMSKSVITPDFEKKHQIPTYEESLNQIKKKRKEERGKTKGRGWFGMKAQEMTEENKNDMMVLQWRRALDPKHFFKAPDIRAIPKFFQMGKVEEGPADFYSARIPKKQRKANLVDELLADAEFRKYNKRKYAEIVESNKSGRGAHRHMKRLKKSKK